jgi:proteic killer suppression protein
VIQSFKDKDAQALFEGRTVRRFQGFERQTMRRLLVLDRAKGVSDLAVLQSNRFEHLKGDRKGQCSIRINLQWRICFRWTDEGPEDVEIVDYHK